MAASFLTVGLLLSGGRALAQQPAMVPQDGSATFTTPKLTFSKEPGAPNIGNSAAPTSLSFSKGGDLQPVPAPQLQPVPPPPPMTFSNDPTPQVPIQIPAAPSYSAPVRSAPAPVYSAPPPSHSAPQGRQPVSRPTPWPDTPIIERAAMMQPKKDAEPTTRAPNEMSEEYQIQLTPPGPQRLFKLESEAAFFERLRQEARQRPTPERIEFPEEPVLSKQQVFAGRYFPRMEEVVEPSYVCYGRLYFENKNFDRFGWDLGFVQPFVSGGLFFWDVATLPYHVFTDPCRCCECNSGYCLPGDPVPFLLYPPGLSVTGLMAETAAVVTIPFILP
jgi:hypothetical protein